MYYFIILIIVANIIWFGLGFQYFWFKTDSAVKMLLSRENRDEPYLSIVSHAIKFIGAFNFAFMLLSIFSLLRHQFSDMDNYTNVALFFVFFIAHFGQFLVNLPLAIKEYRGEKALWTVLKKRMYFIFRTDLVLAILNLILSIYLLSVDMAF